MTRIKDVKIGDPMGFKLNVDSGVELSQIVNALAVYHGGRYVIGKDKSFVDREHYHINFFSVKDVTENARKVFRNALGKKYLTLTSADKLYTGEILPSADPNRWIGYAIKEQIIETQGIVITDEIKIIAKSCFENKRQNKVYSEKKSNEEKEKKDYKFKLFDYVMKNLPDYQSVGGEYYCNERLAFESACIQFMIDNERYGSIKKTFLQTYYLEYKTKYAQEKWSALDIAKMLNR